MVSRKKRTVRDRAGEIPVPPASPINQKSKGWQAWSSEAKVALVIGLLTVLATPFIADWMQGRRDIEAAKTSLSNALSIASHEVGTFLETEIAHPEQSESLYEAHEKRMSDLMAKVMETDLALAAREKTSRDIYIPLLKELASARTCIDKIYQAFPQGTARQVALKSVFDGHLRSTANLPRRVGPAFHGAPVDYYEFACNPPNLSR